MWQVIGDMDPKQGTTLINPGSVEIGSDCDFRVEAINVIPESHAGRLRQHLPAAQG